MQRQQRAIEQSRIRQEAKPLGELINKMRRAKEEGRDPYEIPPPPPRRKKRPKSQPENKIKNACFRVLHKHGIYAYRQNSGMTWINGHPIRFGTPGAADITGIMPDGTRLEIECKRPGGKQSDSQKQFQQVIEANNGIYWLIDDADVLDAKVSQWFNEEGE